MNPISKRIKSALMTFGSLFVSALVVAVAQPEFVTLVTDFQTWLKAVGLPASLVGFGAVIINELWRAWVNSRKLNQALKSGRGSVANTSELY